RDLAARADVLIENFVPGATERLGIDYAAIRAANPAIVYASVSGFGQTGPYARRPGYNTIAHGMSGLMALTRPPGRAARWPISPPPTSPSGRSGPPSSTGCAPARASTWT